MSIGKTTPGQAAPGQQSGDGRRIVAELSALGEQTERELLATVPSADRESLRRILRSVLDAGGQSG